MTWLSGDVRREVGALLLIAAATGAAFWIGDGLEEALPPFLILLAFAALVLFGRSRSDTVRTIAGVGDERTRSLYERSVAFAGNVVSVAVPTWWLVTVALGEPNDTLVIVALIFGVSFILASLVLSRRG
jgi:uncharacterized membrane protein